MINVYCVLVKPKYSIEHVENLYDQVRKYLTHDFKMTCLTDTEWKTDRPIEFIDVTSYELDTWWNKILLFNRNICGAGINLYFDLDVLIRKNIDFLVEDVRQGVLKVVDTVWKNDEWWRLVEKLDYKNKERFFCNGNSSVMSWVGDSHHYLYEMLMNDVFKHTSEHYGDDTFINKYGRVMYLPKKIMTTAAQKSVRLEDERILIHYHTMSTSLGPN